MTKQEAEALIQKHGSRQAASRATGISVDTFRYAQEKGGPASKAKEEPKKFGRSLADFRGSYDKSYIVPKKIKEALRNLGSGWEYEVNFARIAGISLSDLGNFRDQFADHVVTLRESRRAWAGTAAAAKAMREML